MNRFILASEVRKMKPGQRLELAMKTFTLAGTNPDDVMQLILRAAYEISYSIREADQVACFERRTTPVDDPLRTWVAPDRLDFYTQRPDGLFQRNDTPFLSPSRDQTSGPWNP